MSVGNRIERLRRRIEAAGADDDSGGSAPAGLKGALFVLSRGYGWIMGVRERLYVRGVLPSRSLPCRVVSIGNLVAGGTGKTPMTIFVARLIQSLGYRVVVVSRGYRGRMEPSGGVVSDGRTILAGPEDAGDEPYLMAKILTGIPVVVGRRRWEAGMLAVQRFDPHCIVLDDAFQHRRLQRDLDVVLLDSRSPVGNGHLLPRGRLREPLSALQRAQAVVFTRCQAPVGPDLLKRLPAHCRVFYSVHTPLIRASTAPAGDASSDVTAMAMLHGRRVLAFAGLADNRQFFDLLRQSGCRTTRTLAFADHHRYTVGDLDHISRMAVETGADVLVTTFKDWVKLENVRSWPLPLVAVDVTIKLTHQERGFRSFLSNALKK